MDPYTVALDFERGRWVYRLSAPSEVRAEASWLVADAASWLRELLSGWSPREWETQADLTVARRVAEGLLGLPSIAWDTQRQFAHPCRLLREALRVLVDPVTETHVTPTAALIDWAIAKHAAKSNCLVRPSFELVASLRGIGAGRHLLLSRLEHRQGSGERSCFRVIELFEGCHRATVSTHGVLECVA